MRFFAFSIIFSCCFSLEKLPPETLIVRSIFIGYQRWISPPQEPVEVEVSIELESIADVDLKNSGMDSSFLMFTSWQDPRLTWNPPDFDNTTSITVPISSLWFPDVEVINRMRTDNKVSRYPAKLDYRGYVYYTQKVLVYTSCNMDPSLYPLDVQQCHIDFASPGFPTKKRLMKIEEWKKKNNITCVPDDKIQYKNTTLSALKNVFYEESDEWNLLGYKFETKLVEDNQGDFSSLVRVEFALNRKTAKYGLTLFLPIICLNILVCVGMWMPVSTGESVGFQITVLLAMVVYLDVLSSSVPVFDNVRVAPRLLFLFIISVVGSVFAHITIAMTLWYYDGRHENMFNFSTRRSKFAYNLAKFFQIFKADKYNIPLLILLNVDPVKYSDMKSDLKKKDYQAAWQFYGKMISHFWGLILTLAITISTIAILIDIHVESNCAISALE